MMFKSMSIPKQTSNYLDSTISLTACNLNELSSFLVRNSG